MFVSFACAGRSDGDGLIPRPGSSYHLCVCVLECHSTFCRVSFLSVGSLTYLLTFFLSFFLSYSLEQSPSWKLTGSQLVKIFPAFYGTRRFITAFTSPCHLSLSWASLIQYVKALYFHNLV